MSYANSAERAALITGLRGLAEFFEQNPGVPVHSYADLLVFPAEASDAEMFAEVDRIAALLGVTAGDEDSPAGHYSAVFDFGPVQYRAIAIPRRARNKSGEAE